MELSALKRQVARDRKEIQKRLGIPEGDDRLDARRMLSVHQEFCKIQNERPSEYAAFHYYDIGNAFINAPHPSS